MKTAKMRRALCFSLLVASGSFLAGCLGAQTNAHLAEGLWQEDAKSTSAAVVARVMASPPKPGLDAVVGVAASGNKLVGMSLSSGSPWSFEHALDARPTVVGDVVVGSGGGEVFALDAATGKKFWSRQTGGLRFRGAGDDGNLTVLSFAGARGVGTTVLVVNRDGSSVRQLETEREIGVPAAVAGMAFLPWGNQYVSVLDVDKGREVARLLLRDKVSRAFVTGQNLYFGEVSVVRLDEKIPEAPQGKATRVSWSGKNLPGTPAWFLPGTEVLPPEARATDKVRVFGRPQGATGALIFAGRRIYATYYRAVFALGDEDGAIQWVQSNADDTLAGAPTSTGFVTCDASGRVTVYDGKTGGVRGRGDLGTPLRGCVVQAEEYAGTGKDDVRPSVDVQLAEALRQGDAREHAILQFFLQELLKYESPAVTKTLVDLASGGHRDTALMAEAKGLLAKRGKGTAPILEALAVHYDFLKDQLYPPPVGALAQSLASSKGSKPGKEAAEGKDAKEAKDARDPKAAALLASHLNDPQTSPLDCQRIAEALAILGTPAELAPLRQYFSVYHASAALEDAARSVLAVAQTLLALGGERERPLLEQASKDVLTPEIVRKGLTELLAASAQAAPSSAPGAAPAEPKKKGS
jgi:outer membrane protein assembly factor BamB